MAASMQYIRCVHYVIDVLNFNVVFSIKGCKIG